MRVDSWLAGATKKLEDAGVPSARLDCLVLLEDATGKDRAWLLAHPEYEPSDTIVDNMNKNVIRRETHEPLAYIRGKTEFYGRQFFVGRHVLEPRPESETMIGLLKNLDLPDAPLVVDIGTGSGALAITAMLELAIPAGRVLATDIDPGCLIIAQKNADNLGAHIEFFEADLLDMKDGIYQSSIDVVLANLPYVPDNFQINLAAGHEPRLAIFGGPDGLDVYRRMFRIFNEKLLKISRPSYVLTEALPPQHESLAGIALDNGYSQHAAEGFIQIFAPTT